MRAAARGPALPLKLPFPVAATGPGAGQLPGDACPADREHQPRAAGCPMLGQAAGQRPRAAADPAGVVLGAITPRSARIGHIQLVEMQQVDDAGHRASPDCAGHRGGDRPGVRSAHDRQPVAVLAAAPPPGQGSPSPRWTRPPRRRRRRGRPASRSRLPPPREWTQARVKSGAAQPQIVLDEQFDGSADVRVVATGPGAQRGHEGGLGCVRSGSRHSCGFPPLCRSAEVAHVVAPQRLALVLAGAAEHAEPDAAGRRRHPGRRRGPGSGRRPSWPRPRGLPSRATAHPRGRRTGPPARNGRRRRPATRKPPGRLTAHRPGSAR